MWYVFLEINSGKCDDMLELVIYFVSACVCVCVMLRAGVLQPVHMQVRTLASVHRSTVAHRNPVKHL